MYLPSFLSISWSFTAVPVWGRETDSPVRGETAGGGSDAHACTVPDAAAAAHVGDADGAGATPETVRLVVTGYEWRPLVNWEWLPDPNWGHWVDSKRDDAIDRSRREERARAQPPHPAPPLPASVPGPERDQAQPRAAGVDDPGS